MVDEFSSEQEQVEALQKWIKTHGPSIVVGIVVGLAAIGGWRYWLQYQKDRAAQASAQFSELRDAVGNDPVAVSGAVSVLENNYSDSAYASLAKLLLAKQAAEDGDNAAAIAHLRWVIDSGGQPHLIPIAKLRLARLQFADGQPDAARELLDGLSGGGFTAEAEELSGDLYAAAGQPELARSAYQAAQAAAGSAGAAGSLLQIKIDNLPAEAAQ